MSTYRAMKNPATPGQVRHKVWAFLIEPTAADDPAWAERCRAYWELQQETYGLRLSDFSMVIDFENQRVVTATQVVEVLPGERTLDYVAPRARKH